MPAERAIDLHADAERSIDARDRAAAGTPQPDDEQWYRRLEIPHWDTGRERKWVKRNGGMLLVDAPRVYWSVVDELTEAGVIAAITGYLGENLAVSSHKCVLRKMQDFTPTWHQDGSFMGGQVRAVNVWLALSDCGPGTQAPGLDILPKRVDEILDTQTHGATYSIAIGQGLVDEVGGDTPWISPRFEPGDALVVTSQRTGGCCSRSSLTRAWTRPSARRSTRRFADAARQGTRRSRRRSVEVAQRPRCPTSSTGSPSVRLLEAVYSERHARELIEGTGWQAWHCTDPFLRSSSTTSSAGRSEHVTHGSSQHGRNEGVDAPSARVDTRRSLAVSTQLEGRFDEALAARERVAAEGEGRRSRTSHLRTCRRRRLPQSMGG